MNWNNFGDMQRHAFFETFRRLPQTILMKSPEGKVNISKNVIVREWLPQNDILGEISM